MNIKNSKLAVGRMIVTSALILLLALGCSEPDRFWYPVYLKSAECSTFKGEVYIMTNSTSWRSWPYFLEKETKREIELGTDCTFRKIKDLPKPKPEVRNLLNDEQLKYLIEG